MLYPPGKSPKRRIANAALHKERDAWGQVFTLDIRLCV